MRAHVLAGAVAFVVSIGCGGMAPSGTTDAGSSAPVDAGSVETVHGCTTSAYANRSTGAREIAFGSAAGLAYSPKCMSISAGQTVTFKGDFNTHPLVGGMYMGSVGTTPTPIMRRDTGSTDYTVTFATAGLYPYFCDYHAPTMVGAIWVN